MDVSAQTAHDPMTTPVKSDVRKGKVDRIDFLIDYPTRTIRVIKYEHRRTADTGSRFTQDHILENRCYKMKPRDGNGHDPDVEYFDLKKSIEWCRENGFFVQEWELGARAWKGTAQWTIRSSYHLRQFRPRWERQIDSLFQNGHITSGQCYALKDMDLAYYG